MLYQISILQGNFWRKTGRPTDLQDAVIWQSIINSNFQGVQTRADKVNGRLERNVWLIRDVERKEID